MASTRVYASDRPGGASPEQRRHLGRRDTRAVECGKVGTGRSDRVIAPSVLEPLEIGRKRPRSEQQLFLDRDRDCTLLQALLLQL
eukprot:scaffold91036_cov27-Tisochrysis_lutea.AAC.5